MLTYENFDGSVALDQIQDIQRALGTGVLSGCDPTLPASTSPIQVDVASGTAYVSNTEYSVSAGSVTLPDGDSQHPRKDVVYVDSNGALDTVQGTPREPKDGTDTPGTDRTVYQPEPPDLSSLSSQADAAVVAEIWVPSGATSTADMSESGVTYVRDRRLRPWAAALLTSGTIGVNDLDFDPATQSELDSHENDSDAHHSPPVSVVVSGEVTVSAGGSATVDTGISSSTTGTFSPHLGPTDATQDGDFAAVIRNDSGTGTYIIEIDEVGTSVGGTVKYDVTRVR